MTAPKSRMGFGDGRQPANLGHRPNTPAVEPDEGELAQPLGARAGSVASANRSSGWPEPIRTLGRFAESNRRLFGEPPSETLLR